MRRLPSLDFERLQGLTEDAGSNQLIVELTEVFLSDVSERVTILLAAEANGFLKTLEREAHRIRGAAGNFGALKLAKIAEEVEACARNDKPYTQALSEQLADEFQNVKRLLFAAMLSHHQPLAHALPSLMPDSR